MSNGAKRNWKIEASLAAKRTSNPIRMIVDQLKESDANPEKPILRLSIGDPTVFGNLQTDPNVKEAVIKTVKEGKRNGYAHGSGYPDARASIAKKFSYGRKVDVNDIFITSGCSGALEIAISGLCNENDNILVPNPCFSLYKTICDSKGVQTEFYNLLPEKNWEVDLNHMRSLINDKTKAIIVNNPSNPCGSVFSKEHLIEILKIAEEYCLPIIADEIYAHMVFSGIKFHAIASLTDTVPIISVGGLAKQYLVPGWRLGWIIVYDEKGFLNDVRDGFTRLATLILGPNTLIQGSLEQILHQTPQSYYDDLNQTLEKHAMFSVERMSKIPGLKVITPQGAMYVMVGIELDRFSEASGITDDVTFSKKLLKEESVFVLPGSCFRCKNFIRIVFCPPIQILEEAYSRMEQFCQRHTK